jgi:hypothetical protein
MGPEPPQDPGRVCALPGTLRCLIPAAVVDQLNRACAVIVACDAPKRTPREKIMDAAVYYIEENHRRKALGKTIGYEAAGAQFDTTSKRQIREAVRDLEATGAADELRAAIVATPAAPAKRQKLSPGVLNGPCNNAQNRALISAKKQATRLKAVEAAEREQLRAVKKVDQRAAILARGPAAEAKLAAQANLTVDDIKSILLNRGANPQTVPLGSWKKELAIEALHNFIPNLALPGSILSIEN